jgi:hypothetical protein
MHHFAFPVGPIGALGASAPVPQAGSTANPGRLGGGAVWGGGGAGVAQFAAAAAAAAFAR